jgi:acyl-CoA thioester hydrolase
MTTWSAPVRYAETDQQGVAFNSHYLAWCDETVTALLDELGTPYAGLLARGLDTAVVASELQWTGPVRWGDVVEVDAHIERVGGSSFTIAFVVRAGAEPACRVRTTYVLYDDERRPVRVPEDLRIAWSGRAEPAR